MFGPDPAVGEPAVEATKANLISVAASSSSSSSPAAAPPVSPSSGAAAAQEAPTTGSSSSTPSKNQTTPPQASAETTSPPKPSSSSAAAESRRTDSPNPFESRAREKYAKKKGSPAREEGHNVCKKDFVKQKLYSLFSAFLFIMMNLLSRQICPLQTGVGLRDGEEAGRVLREQPEEHPNQPGYDLSLIHI